MIRARDRTAGLSLLRDSLGPVGIQRGQRLGGHLGQLLQDLHRVRYGLSAVDGYSTPDRTPLGYGARRDCTARRSCPAEQMSRPAALLQVRHQHGPFRVERPFEECFEDWGQLIKGVRTVGQDETIRVPAAVDVPIGHSTARSIERLEGSSQDEVSDRLPDMSGGASLAEAFQRRRLCQPNPPWNDLNQIAEALSSFCMHRAPGVTRRKRQGESAGSGGARPTRVV